LIEIFEGWFNATWHFAKKDFQEWPLRFCLELVAWAASIGCSITMALTVPHPPLLYLYPVWITGCAIYSWASWTRGSFGMLANYIVLVSIDMVGMTRMISSLV
jgi:hypothetical protein